MPRIPDSIQSPSQILRTGRGTLHHLIDHARELLDIQQHVRQVVPGTVYVAALDADCLHLITPSSALATRVRYNQRKLLAALRQRTGKSIVRVKVSVRPEQIPAAPREPRAAHPLSPEAAQHLASSAKYIEDEDLRKAIIRLSNRALGPETHQ